MRRVSLKRERELAIYRDTKKRLFLEPLKKGELTCFLSNKPIRIPLELRDEDDDILLSMLSVHHIEQEKENEHLYDPEIMKPVLPYYHTIYHNTPIQKLMILSWFKDYMKRIEITHPKLWQKEMRKLEKS